MSELDPASLPGATLEELFTPDEVVALDWADGTVRLLMYCGRTPSGEFAALKHAVLDRTRFEGLFSGGDTGT